jgi:NADH-quinone oxidoreductase subunit H
MRFGWRVLIPVSLSWVVLVGAARALQAEYRTGTSTLIAIGAAILLVVIAGQLVYERRRAAGQEREQERELMLQEPFDPYAGGYPVPPMPGQDFAFTPRARRTLTGTTVAPTDAPAAKQED